VVLEADGVEEEVGARDAVIPWAREEDVVDRQMI